MLLPEFFILILYFFSGTANILGIKTRLEEELKLLTTHPVRIHDGVPVKRQYLPWLGASMLSKSTNLIHSWISQEDYYANSRSFSHAKCY